MILKQYCFGQRYRIIKKFFLLSFLLFFFPSSAFSQNQPNTKYGGQLVQATTSDPKSFNLVLAKETSTTAVVGRLFEGLTRTNAVNLEVEPNLAERWEVSEDGLRWTFYLRRDVQWFDGHPFSAEDVVFTFNDLIYNPNVPSSSKDIFTIDGKIFQVEKVNDYTVRFTLPVKFAPFLRGMGEAILPKHILKKAVDEGKFNHTWGIDAKPEDIIGTGPYKLVEYSPGERIVLERNPNYWRVSDDGNRLPYIEKIVYVIVQNEDVALLKFMDGEVDYYGLRGIDYPIIKPKEQKGKFTVYNTGPTFSSSFITFNQNREINPKNKKPFVEPHKLKWFTNLEFRKAVAHAIDKKKIIEILMNGLGYPQHSAMSPSAGFFHNPKVVEYEYDLEKAKKILKQAGFEDRNGDGIIEDTEGHDVKFNLFTNSGNVQRIRIASIIRHDLEQLGMKVNFSALEFNNLVSKLTSNFEWEAIILGLTGGVEPHFGQNVWHSSGNLHMWHPRQKSPVTKWEARLDEIFTLGVQELDQDKRKPLYDEFQWIVSEQLPFIYTVFPASIFAVRDKFENLQPTSFGGAFHNLEEISIRPEYR